MKTQAFLLVALLLLAFSTQVYGTTVAVKLGQSTEVKQDMAACAIDVYNLAQLGYRAYNAISKEDWAALFPLIGEFQALSAKITTDCFN